MRRSVEGGYQVASKDSTHVLYGGTVRINYLDGPHSYWRADLQPDGSWGKKFRVKGVTTMMDKVLEKSGLMQWPKGLALRELFGFYDFKNEKGEQMTGFSKNVGTLIDHGSNLSMSIHKDGLLEVVTSASKAWARKKKTGADIGSLVHNAIEQFITRYDGTMKSVGAHPINIEEYRKGQVFDTPEEEAEWEGQAAAEVEMAKAAFLRFLNWWRQSKAKILGAEQLVYSKAMNFCGTFDGLIEMDGKVILCDWKTSNASTSREAASPQGVYYSYFLQSAAYAAAWKEMGNGVVDDLLIVSCRKDGGFDTVSASELGLSVGECIEAWNALATLHGFIGKAKTALLDNVKEKK